MSIRRAGRISLVPDCNDNNSLKFEMKDVYEDKDIIPGGLGERRPMIAGAVPPDLMVRLNRWVMIATTRILIVTSKCTLF